MDAELRKKLNIGAIKADVPEVPATGPSEAKEAVRPVADSRYCGWALRGTLPSAGIVIAFTVVARKAPSFTAPSTRTASPTWISPSVIVRALAKRGVLVGYEAMRSVVVHARMVTLTPSMAVTLPPARSSVVGLHLAHLLCALWSI